jgi:tetratricopeptide (TPR) repeat protein
MFGKPTFLNDNRLIWVTVTMVFIGLLLSSGHLQIDQILSRNLGMIFFDKAAFDQSLSLNKRGHYLRMSKAFFQDAMINNVTIPESTKRLDLAHSDVKAQDFIGTGDLWAHSGEWENAKDWYTQAIELDQSLSNGWYKLGFLYQKQHKSLEAVEAYQQSIALGKFASDSLGLSDPYCRLGFLFRQDDTIRDLSRSQESLETGLRLADFGSANSESNCCFELGNVLRWRNRPPEEYIEFYRRAVTANPQNAEAHIKLGVAYYQLTGDVAQAEKSIQASLSILPSVQAYQELAKIYEQNKDFGKAIEMYDRALHIEPGNQSIKDALTRLQE